MQRLLASRFRFHSSLLFAVAIFALTGFGFVFRAGAQAGPMAVGQWQGATEDATPARVVLLVKSAGASGVSGVVYLLDGDNANWPHATTSMTVRDGDVALGIANIEVSYTGKLSTDGASVSGVWKQHAASAPLKLVRVAEDAAWEIPSSGKAMPVTADPSFEIATIKPADPSDQSQGFQLRGERLRAENETLEAIVSFAYGIHRKQILNAPAWFASERWEIEGTADTPGEPSLKQMRGLYRKLLEERFGLKLAQETREIPVYAMQVDKDAPKLTRSVADGGLPDSTGNMGGGQNEMRYTNMTMDEFAADLGFTEDRPVVNRTGLPGRYDFRLRWSSADAVLTERPDAPPVLFTAMKEQLGLKVEAVRAPAAVYVVSHVERPSAN